ncbi:WbqC family protein [Geitlerinema calcuttense NRMC-F 0142]|uniref:WbqC family protein n=2 Tax=Geitlerinema TaxID=63132 RepID=A0ABT7LYG2_9CYAN|nr:WbqC family protein [Geitlerinema calcuttense NRMC-F 0142]
MSVSQFGQTDNNFLGATLMTIAAVHQPQYFPYLGFFHKLARADIFIAMDSVEFLRRGLQHRNKIKTRTGEQWLTVPVFHQEKQHILQVQIDRELPWARKHWGTLKTNYQPAPYFDLYASELQQILCQDWSSLCELNMTLLQWVMQKLDIHIPIVRLSELKVEGHKSELLIYACQAVGADTYLSGSGGRRYMDLSLFEAAGVKVLWQEFAHPLYPQLFPQVGFISQLSILDVLFCCGPDTCKFLDAEPLNPQRLEPVCCY